jgi:Protein of unknown function (DUF1326)
MQLKNVAGAAFVAALAILGTAAAASAADADAVKPKAADTAKPAAAAKAPDWAMNATVIEACSCPMFCQCYFNAEPAGHGGAGHEGHGGGGEHFCRANNAYKINKGHYGTTSLDGAKFWISADLGASFADGEMDWAVLTFDKSLTPAQREGIGAIAGALFPVKWKSLTTAEGNIDKWEFTKDEAVALLDGGKTAEVRLKRPVASGSNADEPVVIKNLKYWGAPRNDGFIMMGPNVVEAYRVGPNAFEYKGTNGFMVTIDITSKDVAAAAAASKPTMD